MMSQCSAGAPAPNLPDEGLVLRYASRKLQQVLLDDALWAAWPFAVNFLCVLYECFHEGLTTQLVDENTQLLKAHKKATDGLGGLANDAANAKRRMFAPESGTLRDCFFLQSMETYNAMTTAGLLNACHESAGDDRGRFVDLGSELSRQVVSEEDVRAACLSHVIKNMPVPALADFDELTKVVCRCRDAMCAKQTDIMNAFSTDGHSVSTEAVKFFGDLQQVMGHAVAYVTAGRGTACRPVRLKQLQTETTQPHMCQEALSSSDREATARRLLSMLCENADAGMHGSGFLGASLYYTFFVGDEALRCDIQRTAPHGSGLYRLLGQTATFGNLGVIGHMMSIPSDELLAHFHRLLACDIKAGVSLSINELGRTTKTVQDQRLAGLGSRTRATKFALDFDCKLPSGFTIVEREPSNADELDARLRELEGTDPDCDEVHRLRNKRYGNWEYIGKFVVRIVSAIYGGIDRHIVPPPTDDLEPGQKAFFQKFEDKCRTYELDSDYYKGQIDKMCAKFGEALQRPFAEYMRQKVHNAMLYKLLTLGCSVAPPRTVEGGTKFSSHMVFFHFARHVDELFFMANEVNKAIASAREFEWSGGPELQVDLDLNLYGSSTGPARRLQLRPNFVFKVEKPPPACEAVLNDTLHGAACLCAQRCFRIKKKHGCIQAARATDPDAKVCSLRFVLMGNGQEAAPSAYAFHANPQGCGSLHAIFNELQLTSVATFSPVNNCSDYLAEMTEEHRMSGFFTNAHDGEACETYNSAFLHNDLQSDAAGRLLPRLRQRGSERQKNIAKPSQKKRGAVALTGLPPGVSSATEQSLIAWVNQQKNGIHDPTIAGWSSVVPHASGILDDTYPFRHVRIKSIECKKNKAGGFVCFIVFFEQAPTPCYNLEHYRAIDGRRVYQGCRGACHKSLWFTSYLKLQRNPDKLEWTALVQCSKDTTCGTSKVFQMGQARPKSARLLRPAEVGLDGRRRKAELIDKKSLVLSCKEHSGSSAAKSFSIKNPGGWAAEIYADWCVNEAEHALKVEKFLKRRGPVFQDTRGQKQQRTDDALSQIEASIERHPPSSAAVERYATVVGEGDDVSWQQLRVTYDGIIAAARKAGRGELEARLRVLATDARSHWR